MLREYINNREALLKLALQYRSEHPDVLTDGEQICINQERGHLFRQLENYELEDYEQPEALQNKIRDILTLIKKERWEPKEETEY